MNEYIGRGTILKVLADSEPKEEDWRTDNMEGYDLRKIRYLAASNVYEEIKDVLSCKRLIADVAPVVHGHWCEDEFDVWCSNCSCAYPKDGTGIAGWRKISKYCDNCGAKMDESEGE